MPNWVTNTLTISGEKNRIAEVRARLENGLDEGNFLKNIISPKEGELENYKSKIDSVGWYKWNIQHWGTKWDVSEIQIAEDEREISYGFTTAWSPPTVAMATLSEQYPDLEIGLYFIEEQGWGGEALYQAGVETIIEEWDIPDTHADSIKYKGECDCDWNDDQEYWFDDCPREEKSE